MNKTLLISLLTLIPLSAMADNTPCASMVFQNSLAQTANSVSETDTEEVIEQWIQTNLSDINNIKQVLACPEFTNAESADVIEFDQIKYTFPMGREIVINYATQPNILQHKITLSQKRDLPPSDPNARIDEDDGLWTNTNPAWYGIIVVEHGTLDNFVGPDKNNTISLSYIHNNIDTLYPQNFSCTSKSALAMDTDAINQAVTITANDTDEKNDFYVAGDIDLGWISYAEMALDVVLTIASMGGSLAISGATKVWGVSKAGKNLVKSMRVLAQTPEVAKYIKQTNKLKSIGEKTKKLNKKVDDLKDSIKKMKKANKNADVATQEKELKQIQDQIKKNDDEVKDLKKQITESKKNKDVQKYNKQEDALADLDKYRNALRAGKKSQTGNIVARSVKKTYNIAKSFRAMLRGNAQIARAAKMGRTGKWTTKARNILFHKSLQYTSALAKLQASTSGLYAAIAFVGDMYDRTETSTGEFTNNIDFSPLLLLSADDLTETGQENVVNYGMWLMWVGDTFSAADDDAAYLQAMDFATKFHEDLMNVQNNTNSPCNVDIYVVRPIIHNIGSPNAELYYLIMNDHPWTTNLN